MFVVAITIIVLLVAILYFVMRPRILVEEAPVIVREVQPVVWMPWSWGWGSGGWSGSAVVDRPMPHYGPLPRPRLPGPPMHGHH